MGHTPGPWTLHGWADNDYEINAALDTVCNVPGFDDDTVDADRAEANARLIAAAPELLAACRMPRACLADWCEIAEDDDQRDDDHQAMRDAQAAIAKAEGRTNED